jgi:hypothetical protein
MKIKIITLLIVLPNFLFAKYTLEAMDALDVLSEEQLVWYFPQALRYQLRNDDYFDYMFTKSGSDSNMVVRAAKEVCRQYTEQSKEIPIHIFYLIGKFGTTNDLSFADNYLTNAFTGLGAVSIYESINGYNQRTIDATRKFLSVSNIPAARSIRSNKALAVSSMLYRMQLFKPEGVDKNLFFSFGLECVSNKITTVYSFDGVIDYFDPTFRYSKRRLGFLRYLQTIPHSYSISNYISKAISELVAYPESKLNE